MKENESWTYEEKYAAFYEYPDAGRLLLNIPIPAIGQLLDIPADAPTDNWESVVGTDARD